jgi:hypothetical protein
VSTSDLGRHAAILQLVAEQLRSDNFSNETEALYACTDTLEQVAAALLCNTSPSFSVNV